MGTPLSLTDSKIDIR
ncbi:hypothetical protein [Rheinheimera sp. MMS21-TC3]